MDKQEAVARLEFIVKEHEYRTGAGIAGELKTVIGMEPTGWETAENAIIWQGFRIYESCHYFGSGYSLATDVVLYSERKQLFRKTKTVAHCERITINSPRDMLNILKKHAPWEER